MSFVVETPEGWKQSKVGHFCDVQLGKMLQSEPSSDADVLKRYLRAINISKGGVNFDHEFEMWIKPQELKKYALRHGDVLVSEGGDAGRTAHYLSPEESYFQNAINRVRPQVPDHLEARFIYYWFSFLKLAGYVEMVCNVATLAHFTAEKVSAAPFLVPPIEIQKKIAAFLDEKTAQIDGLIEKKRALLDRMAEKRQALITQAVTKGLNPNAPMKDSGIDWLGQVPEHWEVMPLRRVREYMTSGSRDWAAFYSDEGEPFIRMTNVTGYGIELDLSDLRYVALGGTNEGTRTATRNGDILITITAELGAVAVARAENAGSYINQHLALFRPNKSLCNSDFLANFLSTSLAKAQLELSGQGGTKQGLGFEQINNLIAVFPPLDEQNMIASFCASSWSGFGGLEGEVAVSIDLLEEYRAALISSTVTGKLDDFQ